MIKKFSILLFIISSIVLLHSCGSGAVYCCQVNSVGAPPSDLSYHIVTHYEISRNNIESIEFVNVLKQRLSELGYVETNPKYSKIIIEFSYYMGKENFLNKEKRQDRNTSYRLYGEIKNTEKTPYGCKIEAFDKNSFKKIWSVEASSVFTINYGTHQVSKPWLINTRKEERFRSLMPWLISATKNYIGKNFEGEAGIYKKDGVKRLGLHWPYKYININFISY